MRFPQICTHSMEQWGRGWEGERMNLEKETECPAQSSPFLLTSIQMESRVFNVEDTPPHGLLPSGSMVC